MALSDNILQLNQTNNVPQRTVTLPVVGISAGTNVTVSESSGVYTINSAGGGGGGGSGIVASSSQGQLPFYKTAGVASTISGTSVITFNSTNESLNVLTSVAGDAGLMLRNTNAASTANGLAVFDESDSRRLDVGYNNNTNESYIWSYAADVPLKIATNGTERMRILAGGNVGIGTTSPGTNLDVNGNVNLNNQYTTTGGETNPGYYVYKSGDVAYGMKLQYTATKFGTMIFGPDQSSRFISFGKVANGAGPIDNTMIEYGRFNLDDGFFGLGPDGTFESTDPAYRLHVVGTTQLSGNTEVVGTTLLSGNTESVGTINMPTNHGITFDNTNNNNQWFISNRGSNAATLGFGIGNIDNANLKVVFDGDGDVGIGTTNPSYPLHVMQGSNTYGMYMFNNGSKGIYFGDTNNDGTGFGKIGGVGGSLFLGSTQVYTSFIPTSDSSANLGQSNRRWSYSFFRYGQFGYSSGDDENSGSGGYVLGVSGNADRHPFMVKAYGDEGVPSFIVTSGSNVGVGDDSPVRKLSVNSSGIDIVALFKSTDNRASIQLSDDDTNRHIVTENSALSLGPQSSYHNNNLNIVGSPAQVGIGTTLPATKLDVVGSITAGSSSYTTISDNEYDVSSGDFLLDVADDITLDAAGGDVKFSKAGGNKFTVYMDTNDNVWLQAKGTDKDLNITGVDNDTGQVTALSFDMSEAGLATFNTTPIVGTMTSSDNSTKAASTAYVTTAVAAAGGGDVSKSGTPVDNQVAIWTGTNTIEGSANLTFDGNHLKLLDDKKLILGTGDDMQLYHNGSNSYVTSQVGDLNILNTANDADIKFKIKDNNVETEVIRIVGATSRVGIGTTGPGEKLQVAGNIRIDDGTSDNRLIFNNHSTVFTSDSNDSSMQMRSYGGSSYNYPIKWVGASGTSNSNHISFLDDFVMISGSKVGIGTTNPQQPLHVLTSANDQGILIDVGDDTHEGRLLFGDTSSNAIGHIGYNHALETMRFTVGGYETVRMANDGSYSKLFLGGDSTLGLYRYSNRMDFYISSNPRMHLDASKLYSATSGGPLLDLTPTGGEANYGFYGDQNTGMSRSAADTLHLLTAGVSGMTMNSTQGVGIGVIAPDTLRQGQGLTISGTAITSTAYTSSTHEKATSLFVPSLGSGSYVLAGIGGRNSQMGDNRAEPPIMVIGDVGTSLHQTTMGGGRAVSLVLAGTAGYNSGGQDYGNFGSLLFHGNSNWSGNARRWLVTNAWRRSGAGDMGLGFASETSASLDPTVSGSTPSVVFSTDSNYGTAGKGGLLVGNTSHIATGKVTVVDADNGVPLTLAWDGSNYTTFSMDSSNNTVIQAHQGHLSLKTDTGGKRIRLDSKGDVQADLGGAAGTYLFKVVDSSANWLFTVHDDGLVGLHGSDPAIEIKERASAPNHTAAFGKLWVKNDDPANLYYTDDAGNDIALTDNGSAAGGGGSAAGADTQVQFNDGGSSFGGDAGLTYVKGTDTLTVASNININANLISGSSGHLQLYAADNVNLNSEAGITNFNYRGTETFRIAAGASSPVTLQPKASGYDLSLAAQDGTSVLHLDSTDKHIGIGTTNPSYKLDVYADISTEVARFKNTSTNGYVMRLDAGDGSNIRFQTDHIIASQNLHLMNDNANLYVRTAGYKFGVGTSSPATAFHVSGTNIVSRFQDTTGVAFTDIKRIGVEDTYAAVLAGNAGQALGTTDDAYTDIWTNKSRYIAFRHATGSTTDGATTYMSGSRASSEYLRFKTTGNNYSKGAVIEGPNELYVRTAGKDLSLDSGNNFTVHYDKEYAIYNDTGNPVFHIRSGSSAAIEFEGDGDMRFKSAGTSTKMSMLTDGKVGIGTTTPGYKLDVFGDARVKGLASHQTLELRGDTGYGAYINYVRNNGSYAFRTGMITNASRWDITDYQGAGYEALSVDSSLNIGIQNTSPNYALDVNGDIRIEDAHYLRFGGNGASDSEWIIQQASNNLNFGEVGVADNVLYLKAGGNVGIGTAAPSTKLHVVGDALIDGYLHADKDGSPGLLVGEGGDADIYYDGSNMFFNAARVGTGKEIHVTDIHASGASFQNSMGESVYLRSAHAGFDSNAILQHSPNIQYVKAEQTSAPGVGAIPTELPLAESGKEGLEITVMQRWDADPEGALTVQKQTGSSDVIYEGGSNSASATVSIAAYRGANKTFVVAAVGVWVVKD